MRKSDVEFHTSHRFGQQYPAINVKMYRGKGTVPPDADDIMDKFGCDEKTAEKAREFALDANTELFWEQAVFDAEFIFNKMHPDLKVNSAGRSGGWLIVRGLPEVESWDAVMLGKWAKFVKCCRESMKYLCSKECFFEAIEANKWHQEGAEKYNFRDDPVTGETQVISELKAKAKEAGFGSVLRP